MRCQENDLYGSRSSLPESEFGNEVAGSRDFPSKAEGRLSVTAAHGRAHRSLLDDAVPDINRLIEFHEKETGSARGRRRPDIQVVSRSAVVLISAYWEAFCEDLAAEGLRHLAEHAPDGASLPTEVKKTLKKALLEEKNELAIWDLAGDGWRSTLRRRAELLSNDGDRSLNTPKASQVKDFFLKNVGISNITSSWRWHKNASDRVGQRLDEFVTLRGAIAHRGSPSGGVLKKHATDGLNLVLRLAACSAKRVSDHLEQHAGVALPLIEPSVE